ncbi:hypothetical protein CEXT_256381 [Caerostris extrusa]|uniref:Uncharacterized protein n=1 Tax=Caerostris extrusa TaxID=172846 RepID=A0AAV4MA21_CAEEX|nr:hypothetical protein CEXT_256381 [Caerostris extrusa]
MYRTVISQYPSSETGHPKENPSTNRLASTTSIVPKGHLLSLGGEFQRHKHHPPWKTPSAFDLVFKTFNYDCILFKASKMGKSGGGGGGDEDIVVPLRTNGRGLNGWNLLAWNWEAISADAWMLRRLKINRSGK